MFAIAIAAINSACTISRSSIENHSQSGVYDRVIKSGTIRCGYLPYPPYCMKDPNTNKLSGIFVETIELVGKRLDLKIVWSDEVGYESLFAELTGNFRI